jgi:hypothetical protein
MFARTLCLFPLLLAACGTVRDWREMRSDPMPIGQCFDGIVEIAGTEFVADASGTDRGEGLYLSRWRQRVLPNRHLARNRLRLEVMLDEGSATTGWPIRYYVEQETVDDPRRDRDPREEDWSADGQDSEKEVLFGERLMRRVAPKAVRGAAPVKPVEPPQGP